MDRPWGLSGPAFLWLYGAGLVVALGVAVYLRWWVRRPRLVEPLPAADANMVAYLSGGKRQMVETSLARLIEQRAVRVTRDGKVTTTATSNPDPLDHAVLIRMGGRRARRVHEVLDRAAVLRPIADLADFFAAQPLQVPADRAKRARRLGVLLPYLLLVVGLARLVNGLAEGYPVGYLAVELLANFLLIGMVHQWGTRYNGFTIHARRIVDEARTSREAAMLVALGGVAAYPDREIASALGSTRYSPNTSPLRRSRATRAAAAGLAGTVGVWGSGASCGSSGASCGGGSSCGGGGGGCGGGGS